MNTEYSEEELKNLPFMNSNLDLEKRVDDLLNRLTIEEKLKLCSGRHMWFTKPIKRLGIKPFAMHDGPHGVRPDIGGNVKTTYFPCGICRAATWNPELSYEFGKAIAEEVREVGAHMLLAPGINIQRTPLCGRNFEYQTEDPYLNKILAVSVVKGIQSQKIAACVKHYACNNQETNRFTVSSELSERALQEIYLPAFKATVQESDAWSFMGSYNKVNGIYSCENKNLIRERLMKEWGFKGFVVSDWKALDFVKNAENAINAGLTLEMPTTKLYKERNLQLALEEGKFTVETLNDNIRRLLRVMFLVGLFDDDNKFPTGSRNTLEHQTLARKIAEEGIVLLKNKNKFLPLGITRIKKIAILGPNAELETASGGGSSMVYPPYEITPLKGLKEKCDEKINIINSPKEAELVILFVGLNHEKDMDAEFLDRKKFELPSEQIDLINATVKENPKTIVVLISGSPVSMIEWIDQVPSVIQAWYGGMEAGRALANIIFGDINPSGKLPITFPKTLKDSPAHISKRSFPGNDKVYYDEGIFVGYRYFDTKKIEPLFPFGHGLSYTTFKYENLRINKNKIGGDEKFTVFVDIYNSGNREGAEIAQLYVEDIKCSIERPIKELKAFKKVKLRPDEKLTVNFELDKEALSFYDEKRKNWIAERGQFNILIGSSSRNIRLQGKIEYLG
jgi:beta-glucosidase